MIGQLTERVTVSRLLKTSNNRGGWNTSKDLLGVFWANIQPLDIREQLEFQRLDKKADTSIYFRNDFDFDTNCIVEHEGMTYKIEAVVKPVKWGKYMKVVASGVNTIG